MNITLYPDSQLGDYLSVFDELMVGSIEMAHISVTRPMTPASWAPSCHISPQVMNSWSPFTPPMHTCSRPCTKLRPGLA